MAKREGESSWQKANAKVRSLGRLGANTKAFEPKAKTRNSYSSTPFSLSSLKFLIFKCRRIPFVFAKNTSPILRLEHFDRNRLCIFLGP